MSCKNCVCDNEKSGPCKVIKIKEPKKMPIVRICRGTEFKKCTNKLPKSRYFKCLQCEEELGDDVDGVNVYCEW